jgi:LacI family transcriptional regulator
VVKSSITIYDIAKTVNTSPTTVSRVLSNNGYPVSDKLRTKIINAAKELNYIPNIIGRQLKTKDNLTIGVLIPTISNPYYSSVVLGIEEVARSKGYNVLLCNSQQSVAQEKQCLQMLFERRIAGLIVSSISSNNKSIDQYIDRGMNVVAFDQLLDNSDVFQIDFDYKKGGYLATKHLIEKGHEKIAYLSAPLDRPSRNLIYEGYKQAFLESGIKLNEKLFLVSHSGEESIGNFNEFMNGQRLARKLLELPELPTAAFVCNDMTAFGVLNELNLQGIKVPNKISLVGFDNIEFGEMVNPPLTTIEQPKYDLGKLSCSILLDSIEGTSTNPYKIMLQPQLIERKSVINRLRNHKKSISTLGKEDRNSYQVVEG